ncbi:MAG TPA: hypothetical protein VNA28_08490 [Solirubrobacteraceae bacterium]|nr:hypothetical protein [Solirubrobacteraceae bacterium]
MPVKHHRGRRVAVAAVACLALLAGCGDSNDKTASTTTTAQQEAAGGSVEDQLGFTRRGINAASTKVENSIAACMKAEGFDYIPVDSVAQQTALTGRENISDAEFEQQFGHGISTLYGRGSAQSDPNATIRNGLGKADRAAYDRALSGGKPEQTFLLAVDSADFTELGGCTKKATDEVLGGTQLLQTLQRKLDELDESVVADQRMVRAREAWRACMKTETGEEHEDSESIEEGIAERFEQIVGSIVPPGQVAPEGTQVDMEALRKLQQEEIALTRADVACEKTHIEKIEQTVQEEKEVKFREENAELLRTVKPLGT